MSPVSLRSMQSLTSLLVPSLVHGSHIINIQNCNHSYPSKLLFKFLKDGWKQTTCPHTPHPHLIAMAFRLARFFLWAEFSLIWEGPYLPRISWLLADCSNKWCRWEIFFHTCEVMLQVVSSNLKPPRREAPVLWLGGVTQAINVNLTPKRATEWDPHGDRRLHRRHGGMIMP